MDQSCSEQLPSKSSQGLGGQVRTEKLGGDVGKGMGLVNDHDPYPGQQLGLVAVIERQVRTKQVVIDHHQVSGMGLLTGGHHVASAVIRTG